MLTGQGLAEHSIRLIGTPYFYGAKLQVLTEQFMEQMHHMYPSTVTASYMAYARQKGNVGVVNVDCSGLIGSYRKKQIGSSQLYSTAQKRIPISQIESFPIGTVLWKSGHVGVYIGNGLCVEAKGIKYGVVKTKVSSTAWKYGLLFGDIAYDGIKPTISTTKATNPYNEPKNLLRLGSTGEGVKWLQYELNEAGNKLTIDGDFGRKTLNATLDFQQSCKIEADGIVGEITRKYLKER